MHGSSSDLTPLSSTISTVDSSLYTNAAEIPSLTTMARDGSITVVSAPLSTFLSLTTKNEK
jgi:hypothetical protein